MNILCGSAEVSTSAWFFISSLFFLYIIPHFAETGLSAEKEQVTELAKNNLSFLLGYFPAVSVSWSPFINTKWLC